MSTLEKLLTISDTDLETLVILYLRRHNSKLRALIHTGINAEGKPIKCAVDGVLHVPGTPSELVHVAVTTHKASEIRRKWLGGRKAKDKPEPGDIAKAHEEFTSWAHEPDAKRNLYLGWNRSLENDIELYRDIKARCKGLDIEVEVIEASQLVDFLDHDSEGQYLRQEFLGIDAFRLSESLLRAIAIRSLDYHAQTFGSSNVKEHVEIHRDASKVLERSLTRAVSPMIAIVAPSGAGKSTLGRQCGMKLNSEGTIYLWVPAEDIKPHISPATLILGALRRFNPSLNALAGDDALQIVAALSSGVILLIDDVNRARLPSEALEAIRVCSRLDADARERKYPRVRFVVPLWPSLLNEQQSDSTSNWEIVELEYYSAFERRRLANSKSSDQYSAVLTMLDSLGGDPFLCDLALSAFARTAVSPTASRTTILKSIIVDVLAKATLEAAQSQNEATQDEFAKALDGLVEHVLATDTPEPSWDSVKASLGDRRSALILRLGKTNRIGWVEQQLDESKWRWKHDRLRDAIVGRWLAGQAPSLLSGQFSTTELVRLTNIPGAAEAWAWALAFSDTVVQSQLIEILADNQPLALAASLALIEFNEQDDSTKALIEGLRNALEGYSLATERFVEKELWPALYRLTRLNNPLVLPITDKFERNSHVNLGRFRNGETRAGLLLMTRFFAPMLMPFPPLNRAAEEYARLHNDRRTEVSEQLLDELRNPEQLIPVVALCGYLQWEELTNLVWEAWQALGEDEKQIALLPLIWALCRCASKRDQGWLEEALLRVRLWGDEDRVEGNTHHGSERYENFTEPLHFMLSAEITEAASETLAKVATDHSDLTADMLYVLRGIDMPATVEAYARLTASFGGSWYDQIEAIDHHDDDGGRRRDRVAVNSSSRDRLWRLIRSDEPEATRKVAFSLWKRFPVLDDLERLRSIPESDPLFDEVVKVRLLLRDKSASSLLLPRIKSKPGVWTPYAYTVYEEPGVADALFESLEAALRSDIIERQYVERIPQSLPSEGVRRLVSEKKEILRSPKLWNSLWRSDVPEALEFLREILPQADPNDVERFSFGSGNSYPVSQPMLDTLAPVIGYFSDTAIHWVTTLVLHAGRADWLESVGVKRKTRSFKGSVRWWLNKEDGRKVFDSAAHAVRQGPNKVRRSPNFYDIERESNKVSFDSRQVLRDWVEGSQKSDNIIVAGMLLTRIGLGIDSVWWVQLDPGLNDPARETWQDTLYVLRRRRWHEHD